MFPSVQSSFSRYYTLMRHRVENILLIASPYDRFILEEDGQLSERLFTEYLTLNLSRHPRFNLVTNMEDGLEALRTGPCDLAIIAAHHLGMHPTEAAKALKEVMPALPVVMMTYDRASAQAYADLGSESGFDGVYLWSGDPQLMLAVLKCVEDRVNAPRDTRKALVRVIILVEDSPAFYSAYLPTIWTEVIKQTRSLTSQGLNDVHGRYRAWARPKVLHARTYEEATSLIERFEEYLLGIITDIRFPRDGVLNPNAGWDLVKFARNRKWDLPILMQSADSEHGAQALEMGIPFVDKTSPRLLTALREFMASSMGFGPFIFRMKDRTEVARASDTHQLLKVLETLHPESLIYHCKGNHFSNWLAARTEFTIADDVRDWSVDAFGDVEGLRLGLIKVLSQFETSKQRGLVTDFVRSENPLYRDFSRIGRGSMGGKARSIAFAGAVLAHDPIHERYPDVRIYVPHTTVICSGIFNAFCETQDLRVRALASEDNAEVAKMFLNQPLTQELMADLEAILSEVRYPLAIRSSSFSEDSAFQPLAGFFETVILPNNAQSITTRIEEVSKAIRFVYASTFFQEPKSFLASDHVHLGAEQMAVVIQRLVGSSRGERFYPDIAGVAQSYNYYPVGSLKANEGLVTSVLGLGSSVAEGLRALRFSPRRPKVLPQMSSPTYALRSSQRQFAALDLSDHTPWSIDHSTIKLYDLSAAESDGALESVGATYDANDDRIYDTIYREGLRIVNFAQVLKFGRFPLAPILDDLLTVFKKGLGTEVEMEFAVSLNEGEQRPELAVLQVRPLVARYDSGDVDIREMRQSHRVLVDGPAIGHGSFTDIRDFIFVNPANFEVSETRAMAQAIGEMNRRLVKEDRPYLLLLPGRIGTEDPWLGVPVAWNQVSGARTMIEVSTRDHWVDPSQGSHFFHNITSLKVGYFNLDLTRSDHLLDLSWLESLRVVEQQASVCRVELDQPLEIRIDGAQGRGVMGQFWGNHPTLPPSQISPPIFNQ